MRSEQIEEQALYLSCTLQCLQFDILVAIVEAILKKKLFFGYAARATLGYGHNSSNKKKCSRVPRWHPSDYDSRDPGEAESAKKPCIYPISRFTPKMAPGNSTSA